MQQLKSSNLKRNETIVSVHRVPYIVHIIYHLHYIIILNKNVDAQSFKFMDPEMKPNQ